MPVSYKGLTIKFGGDTTELQSALKKIQTESKATQSDLKDINKSLKFNPGDTTLLEQKVRNLNKAYGETKQRLSAYKDALSELEAKKASGKQLTEQEQRQYDSLKRSILQCENQLESYGKQLKSATSEAEASKSKTYQLGQTLQDNSDKISATGQKVETVGKTASAAFGGIATAAMASFGQVDEAQDTAIKLTGATGDAADELGQTVKQVASQSSSDWSDIGTAVGQVNTFFGATGDQLRDLSLEFLRFAENNDTDVSSSVENVSMAMKAFGVDSSQTTSVLGVLQTTSQNTGIVIDTLMSDVNDNGAALRSMGLNLQDSITLLGSFEAAGVPADQMLAGLKKAAVNCAKSGTDLGSSMRDLATRLQDPAQQAQATQDAIDLFGSKAALSFVDAAKSGRINLDDLGTSLDGFATKVDDTFEATEDPPDKLKEALHSLQGTGADLASRMLTDLEPAIKSAADMANRLLDAWDKLSPEQQQLAAHVVEGGIAFGGATTAIGKTMQKADDLGKGLKDMAVKWATMKEKLGPVATSLGSIKDGFGTVATKGGELATLVGGKLTSGWTAFTGLLAANPWILVVAGIAAVVAGLVYFFTQTEEGRQLWGQFTGWITQKWQQVQDFFAGVPAFWAGVWDGVTSKVTAAKDALAQGWEGIKSDAASKWDAVKTTIGGAIEGAKDAVTSKAQDIASTASEKWQQVQSDASSAWSALQDATGTAFDFVRDRISDDLRDGQKAGSSASSALKAAMNGDWDTAKSQAANAFNIIKDNITGKMQNAQSIAINAGNAIGEKLGFPGLGSTVANVFNGVRNSITSPIQDAWNLISGIPGRISSAFSNIRISLPHINLPHFNVSWKDIGGVVKLPSIGIDWYKSGGWFDSPSIIGVGEGGEPEHVTPDSKLRASVEDAVARAMARVAVPGGGMKVDVTVNATISDKLDAYTTGQQIGVGIASKLKQRGVAIGA